MLYTYLYDGVFVMKEFYIDKDGFRLHTKLDFPEGNL
jgi:hypothetical protein